MKLEDAAIVIPLLVEHQLSYIKVGLVEHVQTHEGNQRLLRLLWLLFVLLLGNGVAYAHALNVHGIPLVAATLSALLDLYVVYWQFGFLDQLRYRRQLL